MSKISCLIERGIKMLAFCLLAPLVSGCHGEIQYAGEGTVTNTTTRHDGLVKIPERTIRLISFDMHRDFERNFNIGDICFFRNTTVTVFVRFIDTNMWRHLSEFSPSRRASSSEDNLRNIDPLQNRLVYRLATEDGKVLMESDKSLKDYTWGQAQLGGGRFKVDIYNRSLAHGEIPKGSKLKLWFSYVGNPSLTNTAELLVVCRPK